MQFLITVYIVLFIYIHLPLVLTYAYKYCINKVNHPSLSVCTSSAHLTTLISFIHFWPKNVNPLLLSLPNTLPFSVKNTLERPKVYRISTVQGVWRHNTKPFISLLHTAPQVIDLEQQNMYQERKKTLGCLKGNGESSFSEMSFSVIHSKPPVRRD